MYINVVGPPPTTHHYVQHKQDVLLFLFMPHLTLTFVFNWLHLKERTHSLDITEDSIKLVQRRGGGEQKILARRSNLIFLLIRRWLQFSWISVTVSSPKVNSFVPRLPEEVLVANVVSEQVYE